MMIEIKGWDSESGLGIEDWGWNWGLGLRLGIRIEEGIEEGDGDSETG